MTAYLNKVHIRVKSLGDRIAELAQELFLNRWDDNDGDGEGGDGDNGSNVSSDESEQRLCGGNRIRMIVMY